MTDTTYSDEEISGGKLLAFDLGISAGGSVADLAIGWCIASNVFGLVMTPAIATGLGIAAVIGTAIGTSGLLLVQAADRKR